MICADFVFHAVFRFWPVFPVALLLWSILGGLWFVWECVVNEMTWSRMPPDEKDWGFLAGGPLIWLYYVIGYVVVRMLLLFG